MCFKYSKIQKLRHIEVRLITNANGNYPHLDFLFPSLSPSTVAGLLLLATLALMAAKAAARAAACAGATPDNGTVNCGGACADWTGTVGSEPPYCTDSITVGAGVVVFLLLKLSSNSS